MLTIAELARRTGVAATTLRYYDAIGLLVPVRLDNNHRRYPPEAIDTLQLVKVCQALGCNLTEIRQILAPGGGEVRRSTARRKLAEVDRRLRQLAVARAVLSHLAECTHTEQTSPACRDTVRRAAAEVGTGGPRPDGPS